MTCKLDNSPTSNRFDPIELENEVFWDFFFNSIRSTCHVFAPPQFTNKCLLRDSFFDRSYETSSRLITKSQLESLRCEKFSSLALVSSSSINYMVSYTWYRFLLKNELVIVSPGRLLIIDDRQRIQPWESVPSGIFCSLEDTSRVSNGRFTFQILN